MQVSKVNFNVLKVLNHPDVHLMKLYILLLSSRSHQLSVWETADLSCSQLIFHCVHVCVSVCIYSTVNCIVHYWYTPAQGQTRSGLSLHVGFVIGRWQRSCRVDQ